MMRTGLFLLVCLHLFAQSRCFPAPAFCPPAYRGEEYTLYCSDSDSTLHSRFINWEEFKGDDVISKSSCEHNVNTEPCSREDWTVCLEEATYTVKTCIHADTGTNTGTEDDIITDTDKDTGIDTDTEADTTFDTDKDTGAVSFNHSLTLKNVTTDDDGRIFSCKLLDANSNLIGVVTRCMVVVKDKTTHNSTQPRVYEAKGNLNTTTVCILFAIIVIVVVVGGVYLLLIEFCSKRCKSESTFGNDHTSGWGGGCKAAMKPLIVDD